MKAFKILGYFSKTYENDVDQFTCSIRYITISLRTSVSWHQSQGISLRASVSGHQSQGISLRASVSGHQSQASVSGHQSQGISLRASVSGHQSLGISLRASVSGHQSQGISVRAFRRMSFRHSSCLCEQFLVVIFYNITYKY